MPKKSPRRIEDDVLGTLEFDTGFAQWMVEVGETEFMIESEAVIPVARSVAQNLEKLTVSAQKYASKKYLKLKNKTWPDEDDDGQETIITAAEFQERMTLETINVYEDGSSSLWFADGNLFDGHSIEVRIKNDRCVDALIQG
jgi:hypothetical protein